MAEVERHPYVEKAKEASTMYKEKMPTEKFKPFTQTRMALPTLVECISKFSQDQIEAVKSIGIGALIDLRCTRIDHNLCGWLVKRFYPTDYSFTAHGKKCKVTLEDVERIMGISSRSLHFSQEGPSSDIQEMCDKYGFKGGLLQIKDLKEDMQAMEDAGDEFKVRFALLALGCIYCPSMMPDINRYFLHGLKDVSILSKMNWTS